MEEVIRQDEDDTTRLYEASRAGCVESLNSLIQKNPLILRKISLTTFPETPLHVTALLGHLDFTKTLLNHHPSLAEGLDSFKRSPLHLASAEGHKETVKVLLNAFADACLLRDQDGRIPLHYAAIRGHVEVLKELMHAKPQSIYVMVLSRSRSETVMHLCVQYNQLECLKLLVEEVGEDGHFLNSRGADGGTGMTILHLALMLRQVETISYLLSLPVIREEANSVNGMALNMLDALKQSPRDFKTLEVQQILMDAGIKREINENDQPLLSTIAKLPPGNHKNGKHKNGRKSRLWGKLKESFKYKGDWLQDIRGDLMLVATMISTMTFQVAINPPGGVWQDNVNNSTVEGKVHCSENNLCYAGTAVLGYVSENGFLMFTTFNSIAFHASLSVTVLLLTGFPLKNRVCMWVLSMAMCVTVFFLALTYYYGMCLVSPNSLYHGTIVNTFVPAWAITWSSLFSVIVVWNTIRFLALLVRKLKSLWRKNDRDKKTIFHNRNMDGGLNPSTAPRDSEDNRSFGV